MGIERRIRYISASQIQNHQLCKRRWYFDKILGVERKSSPAMLEGTRIHRDIEKFLCGQSAELKTPEARHLLEKNLIPLPWEKPGWEFFVEWEINGVQILGYDLVGFVDLIAVGPRGEIALIDWKTRSKVSFEKAPSDEEIAFDLQLNLYAYAIFELLESVESVEICHVNVLRANRGGPISKVCRATVQRAEVYGMINGPVSDEIREMEITAQATSVTNLPRVVSACYKYGPCEYMDFCKLLPFNPIDKASQDVNLDLSSLKNKRSKS